MKNRFLLPHLYKQTFQLHHTFHIFRRNGAESLPIDLTCRDMYMLALFAIPVMHHHAIMRESHLGTHLYTQAFPGRVLIAHQLTAIGQCHLTVSVSVADKTF